MSVRDRLAQVKRLIRQGKFEIGNSAFHALKPGEKRTATVQVFDHEDAAGMIIQWSEVGTGFGEITIRGDKHTNEWSVDTESMGPSWCARIFRIIEKRMQA